MSSRFVAVLDNIRSLHNVGSMFRTADALGVDHLYLCGMTGRPDDLLTKDRLHKTALGAELTVPWTYVPETVHAIKSLKEQGYAILALEQTSSSVSLFEFVRLPTSDLRSPYHALVVGHEVYGVCEPVLQLADAHIHIPMLGQKESLNVSVAFGIALSHLSQSQIK